MASERTLRRRVLAIGAVVIVAFVGEAAYDSWRLHQQIMAANTRELVNLSRSLATEAERTLQAADALLGDTAAWAAAGGAALAPAAIDADLALRVKSVRQVSTLALVDAAGRQTHRAGLADEPLADVGDRPYFQARHALADTGLSIDAPVRGAGAPALVLSRRIAGADGRFAGIVAATVTLQPLRDAYQAIDLGNASTLLLTLADGTLVIRQPVVNGIEGRLKLPELVAMRAGAPINRMVSLLDGRPKLIAAVGVGAWPLILAVQRDEADALRPWVDEMRAAAIRTLLAVLVTVLTIAGVLRQLARLETASIALRRSESRYAMTMDATHEGHTEWSVVDDSLFLSAKWRMLHGLADDAPVASGAALRRQLALHPGDWRAVRRAIADHLADRTPAIDLDYRVRMRTGTGTDDGWRWIHTRGRCLRDPAGAPLSLFCSAVDISERKREEAEKAVFESRLQQTRRLEALGTLAGGIAHDFNNILGAILGFGEMAQQRTEDGTALRRYLDRVLQSGARARLLVRRILDFSRSGLAERVLVNVQGVVEEVVAMLAPSLPPGVRIESRLATGDAAVMGDATQLFQVAMNLCTNAAQALGDRGRIVVRLERARLAAAAAMLQGDLRAGDHVRLDIDDTGPGIPPEVLARIFDPFFTTKRGGEGTGLGLSVVHGIVSGLGGAIDVARLEPAGTRVSVWLPIAGERAPPAAAGVLESPAGHGEVVMIVDDEETLVQLAEELLAGLGYEPVGFASAESALAAFEANPARFDALLTDHMLPGMAGPELARRVLAIRPGLPVILMSGNLGERAEAAARAAGVRATLHKPLGLQELAEQLAALFPH